MVSLSASTSRWGSGSRRNTNNANSSLVRELITTSRHNRCFILPTFSKRLRSSRVVYGILAIFLFCWALIIYTAIQKLVTSSPSDDLSSRKDTASFLQDMRFSIPCPTISTNSLEDPVVVTSSFSVFHAIITPFWLGQSSQQWNHTLGQNQNQNIWTRARFKLMEAICAPTMRNQTLSNYFWIVIIDEGTLQEPNMAQDLTKLLTQHNKAQRQRMDRASSRATSLHLQHENAYLLLNRYPHSTMGPLLHNNSFSGTKRMGWHDIATQYQTGNIQILVGDQDSWDRAMQVVSSSKKSQYAAILHHQQKLSNRWYRFKFFSRQPQLPGRWYVCGSDLIEWHNPDILLLTRSMYLEQGITVGRVGHRVITEGCPLAGLTLVRMISTAHSLGTSLADDFSAKKLRDLPLCQGPKFSTDCLLRIPYPMPIVVAGKLIADDIPENFHIEDFKNMKPVNELDGPIVMNGTELVWDMLEQYFGMDRYHTWQAAMYLYEHTEEVLLGHPCMSIPNDSNATHSLASIIPGCMEETRVGLSELSKYIKLRRTGRPSIGEPKQAKWKNARNQSAQQQPIKIEKKLPKVSTGR
jgi:hypothetical protein